MRRLVAVLLAVVVVLGAATAAPASAAARTERPASGSAVTPWIAATLAEIRRRSLNPPRAARALALVSVALDRAVRTAPHGSERAAAATAAATVLAEVSPARARVFLRKARRGGASPLGRRIGRALVRRARTDGADGPAPDVVPPPGPATWTPSPPRFDAPAEPGVARWRPWHLARPDALRPGPPPAYRGERHLAEAREVLDVARAPTPAQRALALHWNDGAGSDTPPGHWNRIALRLIAGGRTGARRAAAVLAALNTAQYDALIACWDAKYAYWAKRPVTVVRAELDPGFTPLIPTPPHPSYPSGHAATSGAAAAVLGAAFPRAATRLDRLAADAAVSRVLGGIHFSSDSLVGLSLGRAVAAAARR
jgi:hypothetical protein